MSSGELEGTVENGGLAGETGSGTGVGQEGTVGWVEGGLAAGDEIGPKGTTDGEDEERGTSGGDVGLEGTVGGERGVCDETGTGLVCGWSTGRPEAGAGSADEQGAGYAGVPVGPFGGVGGGIGILGDAEAPSVDGAIG